MAASDGFRAFLEELLEPLGGVSIRRMFGGLGIYRHGLMFALVADDVLYLRADGENRADFEGEGCDPFVYEGNAGRPATMPYWRAPERLFDDPEAFRQWALGAERAAERARIVRTKPRKGRGQAVFPVRRR